MRVIEPGYLYEVASLDGGPPQQIQFIHKERSLPLSVEGQPPPVEPGMIVLKTKTDGTTNEEVLAVLIDRLQFLDKKLASPQNELAIGYLKSAQGALLSRTAERQARGVENTLKP